MRESLVIKDKNGTKFLCWNSFKAEWYWGDLNHSEKFTHFPEANTKVGQLLKTFPTAKAVFVKDSNGMFEV